MNASDLLRTLLLAYLRSILTVALTYAVAKGWLTHDQAGAVDVAKLAITVLAGAGVVLWQTYTWIRAKFTKRVALKMPAHSTTDELADKVRHTPLKAILTMDVSRAGTSAKWS